MILYVLRALMDPLDHQEMLDYLYVYLHVIVCHRLFYGVSLHGHCVTMCLLISCRELLVVLDHLVSLEPLVVM